MDPSALFEQTIHEVSNLQAEFKHLLEEIKTEDTTLYDIKSDYNKLDSSIQKFIRQNGALKEYPKEAEVYKEIKNGMEKAKEIQKRKTIQANTMLYLVAKHLEKLEKGVELLEEDGLLAPIEDEIDSEGEISRASSVISFTGTERKRKNTTPLDTTNTVKKKRQTNRTFNNKSESTKSNITADAPSVPGTIHAPKPIVPSAVTTKADGYGLDDLAGKDLFAGINNRGEEEEDKTLYCFCQSVSYGEMVACDGPNCKYEWFHYGCVNLKEPPQGAWYCPDCRQELAKNTLKKKRN